MSSDQFEVAGKPSRLITPAKYYEEYLGKRLARRKVSKKFIEMHEPIARSTN